MPKPDSQYTSAEPDYFAALTKAGRIKREGGKIMVAPKEDTKRDLAELLRRAEDALDAWRAVNDDFRESAGGDEFIYVGGGSAIELARELTEHYVGYKVTGQK